MTFSPTPGPWDWATKIGPGMGDDGIPIRTKEQSRELEMKFLIGANGQGFAHTVGLGEPEDTSNVRILAAAWELLSELEQILLRFETCCLNAGSDPEMVKAATAKARELIRKIKGD